MMIILRMLSRFFCALPLPVALAIGRGLGWGFGSVIRYRRGEVLTVLRRCFPERPIEELRRIRSRMYANLGMTVVEFLRIPGMDHDFVDRHIALVNGERFEEMRERGDGVIGLTGHIGNWEMTSVIIPVFMENVAVVTKAMKSEAFTRFITETREHFGIRVLPQRNVYRACLQLLREGGTLGFILDQNRTQMEGEFVDFFGKPACTSTGLALLSYQSKTPVVTMFSVRKPGGCHELHLLPPIEPPPDREPETILAYTQRYTTEIENVIRQYPDQWIWIHRRWRTRPPKEDTRAK